ncbi:MAG: hypothetical protein DGJ47_001102, partial [Rickettsiaceae bacterium]
SLIAETEEDDIEESDGDESIAEENSN